MRRRSTARGQALVEFALVLPVFLMLLFGLIDGGRYVFMNNVQSQAAREGARVAAAEASWIGKTNLDDPSCVGSEALITAAKPGAHVCPAAVTGASEQPAGRHHRRGEPDGRSLRCVDLRERLLQLPIRRCRAIRELDDPGLSGDPSDPCQGRRRGSAWR